MVFYLIKCKCAKFERERDDTMAAVSKPVTGAFVLNSRKASEFLTKKVHTSSDAIRRFEDRKAKAEKFQQPRDI